MWIDRPRKLPFIDVLTGVGDVEQGPYFETSLNFFPWDPDGGYDERLFTLSLSATYLRDICSRQGSPAVFVDKDEYDSLIRSHHEFAERIADMSAQLEETRKALDEERRTFRLDDVSTLSDQIAEKLSYKHIKRGPGRPPKNV